MAKNTIYSLRVCNDSTARGIKLLTNFLHQLHMEGNLENRVFVVEDNPRKIPNLRKHPFRFVQYDTSVLLLNNFCPLKYKKNNIALPVKSVKLKIQKLSSHWWMLEIE